MRYAELTAAGRAKSSTVIAFEGLTANGKFAAVKGWKG